MANSLFNRASFWALDASAQDAIRAYVDPDGLQPKLDARAIYLERATLAAALHDAEWRLSQANPALFAFLSADQRTHLEGELLLVFYQLSAQYKLDVMECKGEHARVRATQLKQCADLINQLRLTRAGFLPETQLAHLQSQSSNHTKYLGLKLVVPLLMDTMEAYTDSSTSLQEGLTFINERRLYWVWGGSMISVLLETLPSTYAPRSSSTATPILNGIAPITGAMSWILYFTRAGIEWSRLAAHTFQFAMSEEERALGFTFSERFLTQWNIRKYALMNDTIWGLCNLACFTILAASGPFSYWGDAATALLLLMDVSLTWWRKQEEATAHAAHLARYQQDLDELDWKISLARHQVSVSLAESLEGLIEARREVQQLMTRAKLDWKYKQWATRTDLIYAVSLLCAFCMLCSFFFPPAAFVPATALLLGVLGITLCFTFNLLYAGANMTLDVWKSSEIKQEADAISHAQLDTLKGLIQAAASHPDDSTRLTYEMKQAYLALKTLRADSKYQQDLLVYQRYQLMYSTIRDALIPPLFFAAFVFTPLGIGIPLFVLAVVLMAAPYFMLPYYLPEKAPLPVFKEAEFQMICEQARTATPEALFALLDHTPSKTAHTSTFFKPNVDVKRDAVVPVCVQNPLGFEG